MRFFKISLLWAVPVTAGIAVLWYVSARANFHFGLSLGDDLFGYASLSADVTKAFALFGVFAALALRRYLVAFTLTAIWALCTIWSIGSAVGFMSLHYATMTDDRGKNAEGYTLLKEQIARLEERRRQTASARPESVVKAEIAGLLLTPGAGDCTVINGPVTQKVCPQVAELQKELGHAKSASWLDGRLDELRGEMKATPVVTTVDPRAETIAAILGVSVAAVTKGLAGFFAILLELTTSAGMWAVWSAFGYKPREVTKPAEKPQEPAKASTAPSPRGGTKQPVLGEQWSEKRASFGDRSERPIELPKPHAPSVVVDNTSKATRKPAITGSVKSWKGERLVPTKFGGSTTAALHDDYVSWCRQHGYTPLHKGPFGKKLGQLGLKREGKQKGAWRPGWDLRKTEVASRTAVAA